MGRTRRRATSGTARYLANNGVPATVSLLVTGPDFAELQREANAVFQIVRDTKGSVDTGISSRPGPPEQRFVDLPASPIFFTREHQFVPPPEPS